MIVKNKYANKLAIPLSESTVGLFLLWKMGILAKKVIPEEMHQRFEKWLEARYRYKICRVETEKSLRDSYDKTEGDIPIFSSIEIEVINRCNGECPFCPVNRHDDPRKMKKMDEALFKKIIDELGEMNYSGRLALHSNNEPLLDSRIIEFAKYASEHVPEAYIYMYTNGTLLTLDKFKRIIHYLDKIIIDNYDDELKLHKNAQDIFDYCRSDVKLSKKVEIHVRKIHEILSTRGGQSPNNSKKKTLAMSCILPYRQMIIRPDGKTSLCCNDPYGTNTLADLNKMTLKDAWYSERYKMVRRELRKGRRRLERCRYCDTLADSNVY